MIVRILPPPSALFREAVRRTRGRLGTLVTLALVPLSPLLLFGPFLAEVSAALEVGIPMNLEDFVTPGAALLAFLGLLLSTAAALASATGMFIVLRENTDPGPREAFRLGVRRWGAVIWTQLLAIGAMLLISAPSLAFMWYMGHVLTNADAGAAPLAVVALTVALFLFLPVLLVATWYAFAPIPAALGEAWGASALRVSQRLVSGAATRVFSLLVAWFLLELIFSVLLAALFPGLALFQGLVFYLTTSVVGSAYLYTLYEALHKA